MLLMLVTRHQLRDIYVDVAKAGAAPATALAASPSPAPDWRETGFDYEHAADF